MSSVILLFQVCILLIIILYEKKLVHVHLRHSVLSFQITFGTLVTPRIPLGITPP